MSNVTQANLAIHDSTVNDTVFTGGMVRYADTTGVMEAKVEKSTLVITNSTVKAIENGRGFTKFTEDKGWIFTGEDGLALDSEDNDTVTDLTLVNSTVESVNLSKAASRSALKTTAS